MDDHKGQKSHCKSKRLSSMETFTKKYTLDGYVSSHVGCIRTNNEDNYILHSLMKDSSINISENGICEAHELGTWNCIAIFDGMGGGEGGEEASRIASVAMLSELDGLEKVMDETKIDVAIRNGFSKANNTIVKMQQETMVYGTTGTVCCMNGKKFKIYHLGDSRAYLFREGQLMQITRDQTVAQMKIDAGFYSADDPKAESEKHQLIEYIGCDWSMENLVPIESDWIDICTGDQLLLCSDGLYDMCSDVKIGQIMIESDSTDKAVERMVETALFNGGRDNITCVVVKITLKD